MRKHRAEHLPRAVLHSTNKITRSSSAAFGGTFPTEEGKKGVNKRAVLYKWDNALASPPGGAKRRFGSERRPGGHSEPNLTEPAGETLSSEARLMRARQTIVDAYAPHLRLRATFPSKRGRQEVILCICTVPTSSAPVGAPPPLRGRTLDKSVSVLFFRHILIPSQHPLWYPF